MSSALQQETVRGDKEVSGELDKLIRERAARVRRRLLRSAGKIQINEEILPMIRPRSATQAPRRSGKTESLLYLVDEQALGKAIVIGKDHTMAEFLRQMYQKNTYTGEPIFTAVLDLHRYVEGNDMPIYCDEWWSFPNIAKDWLATSGRVAGAIGTDPEMSTEILNFPF